MVDISKLPKKAKQCFRCCQQLPPWLVTMAYKKILKALYDYEAVADDELNFTEGDLLGVLGDENEEAGGDEAGDEGWYYGCSVMNQSEVNGFIPKTYCEEV